MPLTTTTVTTAIHQRPTSNPAIPNWELAIGRWVLRRARRGSPLMLGAVLALLASAQAPAQTLGTCRELVLYGGKIATMDARTTTASSVVIRDDRIAAVSASAGIPPHSPCARLINLRGRLVIPGMIDTHDHVSYFTARP